MSAWGSEDLNLNFMAPELMEEIGNGVFIFPFGC